MTDIFISYASEDRERAGKLAQAFGAMGWSVWWDRRIIVGQAFDQTIERELEAAKSIVMLDLAILSAEIARCFCAGSQS